MIALTIDIVIPANQNVEINSNTIPQTIEIVNQPEQDIAISMNENQKLNIVNFNQYQEMDIDLPWMTRAEMMDLKIVIDAKVPKALSVLPQTDRMNFTTKELRGMGRVYVDANGVPSFATLEQLKELNTKTICVDKLSDEKIKMLSNEDIILLRKE